MENAFSRAADHLQITTCEEARVCVLVGTHKDVVDAPNRRPDRPGTASPITQPSVYPDMRVFASRPKRRRALPGRDCMKKENLLLCVFEISCQLRAGVRQVYTHENCDDVMHA